MKRFWAVILILTLALGFAACGPEEENPTTTTETTTAPQDSTTAPSDTTAGSTENTTAPGDSTTAAPDSGTTNGTTVSAPRNDPNGSTAPSATEPGDFLPPLFGSSKALMVDAYNRLLAHNPNLKRTLYTRDLTACTVKAFGYNVDLGGDETIKNEAKAHDTKSIPHDLPKLTPEMVQAAKAETQGDTVKLTIQLKEHTNIANPTVAKDGYVGVLDYETTRSMVSSIALDLSKRMLAGMVTSLDITEAQFTLTKGKIVVTAKQDGTIISAVCTGSEAVTGKAKANGFVPATATLAADVKSEYRF